MSKTRSVSGVWENLQSYGYDDHAKVWSEIMRSSDDSSWVKVNGIFGDTPEEYMGRGTVLQRDVTDMPLDPQSAEKANWLWTQTPFRPAGGFGASKTSFNTSVYGTQPVHAYVVDSTHQDVEFRSLYGTSIGNTPKIEIDTYVSGQMPLASWTVPAQNGDHGLALYDVGTGIMREWFGVAWWAADDRYADHNVRTSPSVGGYSLNEKGLTTLAKTNYALQQRRGLATVSGMHNSLGFIGISEAINKKINHALCFTVGSSDTNQGTSWPSRGADGKAELYAVGGSKYDPTNSSHFHNGLPPTPTHGQWMRLPSSVDPMYNPRTKRAYKPFTRVIIEAAKKYGLVMTDTNLFINAFNGEQGRTFKHFYGVDPWSSYIPRLYNSDNDPSGFFSAGTQCDDFPWDLVEVGVKDWGRPSPDWNLRPGQNAPWWHKDDPNNPLNTMKASV